MARTKDMVRAAHARASARGQFDRRTSIAKAARSMSIEQVEAAYQQREVCVPARAAARILFRPLHHDLAQVQNLGALPRPSSSS